MINNDNDRQVLSEIASVEVNNLQVESQTNLAANSSQEENNSNSADEFVADDELIEEDSNDEIEEGELIEQDSSDESEEDDVDPTRNLFNAFVDDNNDEDSSTSSSSSSESSIHIIADQSIKEESSIEDDSSDDDDDYGIVRCAICFNKHDLNNKWRCLVTLPCCGNDGKEENSSTRFCAACMLHLAHNVRPGQIADDEVPHYHTRTRDLEMTVRFFYEHDCQTKTQRYIICPRCKDICVVEIVKPTRRVNTDWTNPINADSISLKRSKISGRLQYVGKKIGLSWLLWKIAFLNPQILPLEALMGKYSSKANVLRLASYGILKKDKGTDMFRMKKGDHMKLKSLLKLNQREIRYDPLFKDIQYGLYAAAISEIKRFHLFSAVRILSRFIHYFANEESPQSPYSEMEEMMMTTVLVCTFAFLCLPVVKVIYYIHLCLFDIGVAAGSNIGLW